MIWAICGVAGALLVVLCVRAFSRKEKGYMRIVTALLLLAAATYIAYLPVYLETYDFVSGAVGNLIHTMQVVTLEAAFLEFYNTICAGVVYPLFTQMYMLLLGILHLAMPIFSALTAVTVLFRCFSSIQLMLVNMSRKPLFVFSEFNERAVRLAKSLDNIRCDIVFANSEAASSVEDVGGKHRYVFKQESISELNLKCTKRKEIHLFCISENEDDSLSYTLQLIDKFAGLKESAQKHIHIYQFSRTEDFAVYIDSADKGMLDIKCINEYERLIYNLLDKYPLFKSAHSSTIHVLLHGLEPINVAALRALAWCGQLSGFEMKVSVVGVGIQAKIEELRLTVPGLFTERYNVAFYDCGSERQIIDCIMEHCRDVNYIIVGGESDNRTMNHGLLLRRLFYRLDEKFKNCPPIFCHIREPIKLDIVRKLATAESNPKRKMSYDLTPFGSLDEVYTYKELVDSDLEKLAKNVHLAYEEIFSDGEIDVKEALKRYSIFEVNKRSNRANALHIRYKLNLLGLDYTDDPDATPVQMSDYYTEEYLEQLSISEHDRWMAFLESEGWIPSEKNEVEAYRESGISKGRHNCPLLKMHPYICPYDDLEELSLDLEGKDTRVYDTELILRIPDILGDKWNVAGKKYTITKLG